MYYILRNEIDKTTQHTLNDPQWYLGSNITPQTKHSDEWSYDGTKAHPITNKSEALKLVGKLISEDHVIGIRKDPR